MRLRHRAVPGFPRLGWLAAVPLRDGDVTALHGAGVECEDDALVEGVWDGPFEDREFHRSEAFFGSGLRIDGGRVVAAASTALVDRLLYYVADGQVVVSNSLGLLLGFAGARPDFGHDYREDCAASLRGIFGQPRPFRVAHPVLAAFQQVYHGNLVVAGGAASIALRSSAPAFSSFEKYAERLRQTLAAIRANYESPARMGPMRACTTLSAGYDSTAVACLARELGVRDCFTTRLPEPGGDGPALENGAPIAAALGLTPRWLTPPSVETSADERYFIAPSMWGSEIVFHEMAVQLRAERAGAVVFTGYHGDKVWDRHVAGAYLRDDILRGDTSGLNLSEIRLVAGFINVAVPFLFARSIVHVAAISRSPEMAPWRLETDYDRPIPRRIAETAGVPRGAFGQRKRVVMSYYNYPWNPELRRDFLAWLGRECGISRARVGAYEALDRIGSGVARAAGRLGLEVDGALLAHRLKRMAVPANRDLRQLMFKWAAARLAEEGATALPRRGAAKA